MLRFSAILVLLSAYLTTVVLAFAQVVVRCTSVKYVKLDLSVTGEQHVYSANHIIQMKLNNDKPVVCF